MDDKLLLDSVDNYMIYLNIYNELYNDLKEDGKIEEPEKDLSFEEGLEQFDKNIII